MYWMAACKSLNLRNDKYLKVKNRFCCRHVTGGGSSLENKFGRQGRRLIIQSDGPPVFAIAHHLTLKIGFPSFTKESILWYIAIPPHCHHAPPLTSTAAGWSVVPSASTSPSATTGRRSYQHQVLEKYS